MYVTAVETGVLVGGLFVLLTFLLGKTILWIHQKSIEWRYPVGSFWIDPPEYKNIDRKSLIRINAIDGERAHITYVRTNIDDYWYYKSIGKYRVRVPKKDEGLILLANI